AAPAGDAGSAGPGRPLDDGQADGLLRVRVPARGPAGRLSGYLDAGSRKPAVADPDGAVVAVLPHHGDAVDRPRHRRRHGADP
nr:hypothetical protein [Tanacetum cinerariifolium]